MRFTLLILIPAFLALGHDIILALTQDEQSFRFTTMGYVWASNFKDSYIAASNSFDPALWSIIVWFLEQKAIVLALGLAALIWVIRLMLGLFGLVDIRPDYIRRKEAARNLELDELEKLAAKKSRHFGFRRNR